MLAAQSSPVSAIVFAVVVLATSLALVAGLAWASRRLLGLPVGALRALIAGLLGFAAAYFLGRALQAAHELQLERALGRFMARYLAGGTAATAEMFTDLFRLATRFELVIPPEIATVLRSLGTLEVTLALLTPGIDIADEARRYAADQVGAVSPRAVPKSAADELIALLPVLRRLPRRFDRVTSAVEQGRLNLNVRLFADERDRRVVTGLTHQVLLTLLGAASGIAAALLIGAPGGPKITHNVSLGQLIGYNLLIVASILALRVLYTIFRNR